MMPEGMRERSLKSRVRPLCSRLLLVVVVFVCLVVGREVQAQEGGGGSEPEPASPESAAGVAGSTVPLDDVGDLVDVEGSGEYAGVAPGSVAVSNLPPITAFKGLSDSAPTKNMLKGLITAQVPVMFQTMMMVENGAATGYIGSLNTVSNLLANTLDTAQLDIRLKQIADPNGGWLEAYNKALIKRQQKNDSQNWVASLWTLGGDTKSTVEQPLQEKDQVKVINESPKPVEQQDAVDTPVAPADAGPQGQGQLLLKEIILKNNDDVTIPSPGGNSQVIPGRIRKLRQFFEYYVGDLRFTEKTSPSHTFRIKDDQFVAAKVASTIPPESRESRGFKLRWWQNKKVVWTAWYTIFDKYCKFKVENPNQGREIFQKKGPAAELSQSDLLKASADDLKITANLIDQIFKLWVQSTNIEDPTKITCDFEGSADETMPQTVTPARVDNCKTQPKDCDRNKIMFKFVERIALSKTLSEYRDAFNDAMGMANGQSPFMLSLVTEVMCKSLRMNDKISSSVGREICDIDHFFDTMAYENREGWVRETNQLSKLAQGYGGSSVFRGTSNSMSNFSPDMGGSQAP